MEHEFNTLTILAEVTIGFVAFSVIVASLRVTLGEKLEAYETLLVHFFTETGLMTVTIALLPMILWNFWPDESRVATYTLGYILAVGGTYFLFYFHRRAKIKTPTSLPSLLVMIGWGIWMGIVVLSLSGIFWPPSLKIVTAGMYWSLLSSVIIFTTFLSTFIAPGKKKK